jgi:hypothetical protein
MRRQAHPSMLTAGTAASRLARTAAVDSGPSMSA